jgi:hypothetical protein
LIKFSQDNDGKRRGDIGLRYEIVAPCLRDVDKSQIATPAIISSLFKKKLKEINESCETEFNIIDFEVKPNPLNSTIINGVNTVREVEAMVEHFSFSPKYKLETMGIQDFVNINENISLVKENQSSDSNEGDEILKETKQPRKISAYRRKKRNEAKREKKKNKLQASTTTGEDEKSVGQKEKIEEDSTTNDNNEIALEEISEKKSNDNAIAEEKEKNEEFYAFAVEEKIDYNDTNILQTNTTDIIATVEEKKEKISIVEENDIAGADVKQSDPAAPITLKSLHLLVKDLTRDVTDLRNENTELKNGILKLTKENSELKNDVLNITKENSELKSDVLNMGNQIKT